MSKLEKEIERKLIDMIEIRGGLCLKWVCPGWAGVPDRIVLLPGGRVGFAETKRPKGGTLSTLQKWWRKKIIGMGFNYWIIWCEENIHTLAHFLDLEGIKPINKH